MDITYDVRIHKTQVYKGRRVTTYIVRWKTGSHRRKESFRRKAQADSYRAELLGAARRGEAFSLTTGYPVAWQRDETRTSWYSFTLAYVDAKWPYISPNHRRSVAEALTDATEALIIDNASGKPSDDLLRKTLRGWTFSERVRHGGEPPPELAAPVRWLERNTVAISELTESGQGGVLVRSVLDRISKKRDGTPAAANTFNRKRMVLNNAMEYACETGVLSTNPLKRVKWTRPRTAKAVDARVVVNSDQARRLLKAVESQGERGKRMVAFFGCMYYAALRPEEVIDLRRHHLVSLPEQDHQVSLSDRDWGHMRLSHAEPRAGAKWTNNGRSRERRELKHRAPEETRDIPIHPELVDLLRSHLDEFGTGREGRLFVGPRHGVVAEWAYLEVWREARRKALTEQEAISPLADTPYTLRHAAVSQWLNVGVDAPQVAEWAGHSVDVLLRVYAKCIAGQERRRSAE